LSSTDEPRLLGMARSSAEARRPGVPGRCRRTRSGPLPHHSATVDLDLLSGGRIALPEAMERLGYDVLLIADPTNRPT
jgi:hypothetical protein